MIGSAKDLLCPSDELKERVEGIVGAQLFIMPNVSCGSFIEKANEFIKKVKEFFR